MQMLKIIPRGGGRAEYNNAATAPAPPGWRKTHRKAPSRRVIIQRMSYRASESREPPTKTTLYCVRVYVCMYVCGPLFFITGPGAALNNPGFNLCAQLMPENLAETE